MTITRLDYVLMDYPGMGYRVAAAAGISPGLLSAYRNGRKEMPLHHALPLSEVLHCTIEDITGWVEETV